VSRFTHLSGLQELATIDNHHKNRMRQTEPLRQRPRLNSKLIGRPVFPFPVLIGLAATLILECERESDAPRSTSEQVFRNNAD
jgi:hypothetical protein